MKPEQIDNMARLLKEAVQHFDEGMWLTAKHDIDHIYMEFQSMYPI